MIKKPISPDEYIKNVQLAQLEKKFNFRANHNFEQKEADRANLELIRLNTARSKTKEELEQALDFNIHHSTEAKYAKNQDRNHRLGFTWGDIFTTAYLLIMVGGTGLLLLGSAISPTPKPTDNMVESTSQVGQEIINGAYYIITK